MERKWYRHAPYSGREERNEYLSRALSGYIGKSVLNVGGGGERYLARFLEPDVRYCEIDVAGKPDIVCNLEKEIPLPIEDNAYETVVCTDVLEHLDRFHDVFFELIRVSSRYVIISLPNPVSNPAYLIRKRPAETASVGAKPLMKYYGLPYNAPEDRHKWYFSATDIENFMRHHARERSLEMRELFALCVQSPRPTKRVFMTLLGPLLSESRRNDLSAQTVWCVLEKRQARP